MIIEQLSQKELLVQIFKALSDQARLTIIKMLYDKNSEMSCGEIGEELNITKSTASYHFKALREAGLTFTRKDGKNKFVRLNNEIFDAFLPGFLNTL